MRSIREMAEKTGLKTGVELELLSSSRSLERLSGQFFQQGTDPSLEVNNDSQYPVELRTGILGYNELSQPYRKLRLLKEAANLEVNSTCGTHIHISFSKTIIPMTRIIDYFGAAETFFYSLGGRRGYGRRSGRPNSYARSVMTEHWASSPLARVGNKYRSVHLYNDNPLRLEVRAFAGTANPTKLLIYQAATLGVAFAAYKGWMNGLVNESDGMLLTNRIFHDPLTSLEKWLEVLDWREGGRWTGFWYNLRGRRRKDLPSEEKILYWLRKSLANFLRVGLSTKNMEEANWLASSLTGGAK